MRTTDKPKLRQKQRTFTARECYRAKLKGRSYRCLYRPETTLTGISVEDRWVTVRYKTAEGRIEHAKQDVAYFYNYWVKMYLRRGLRQNLKLPDDPTVVVNWGPADQEQNNPGT
jgi:hypothetical protein